MNRHSIAAAGLVCLGLLQIIGDGLDLPAVKAIGAATAASPAPKVFSAVRGFETYSTRFYLEWDDRRGIHHSQLITPRTYARLAGPYNRRNVYGAVLAYGPVLATDARTRPMFDSVTNYALCGNAPLLRELGINPDQISGGVSIRYEPVTGTAMEPLPRILRASCQ